MMSASGLPMSTVSNLSDGRPASQTCVRQRRHSSSEFPIPDEILDSARNVVRSMAQEYAYEAGGNSPGTQTQRGCRGHSWSGHDGNAHNDVDEARSSARPEHEPAAPPLGHR